MQLSKQIQNVFFGEKSKLKFREILNEIDQQGFGLLLVILALPAALPFTPPGISTPFGLVLIPLSWQMINNKSRPWFPEKIQNLEIDVTKSTKFAKLLLFSTQWLEKLVNTRWQWFFKWSWINRILGIAVLVNALIMTLPFPITNTPPSIAILLIGLCLLEKDGLSGVLGLLSTLLAIVVVCIILVLIYLVGWTAFDLFKSYFYQFLLLK